MWQDVFFGDSYDKNYEDYVQAAHRVPSFEVGAPGLNWHVGVWFDPDIDPQRADNIAEQDRRKRLLIDKVNSLAAALQNNFSPNQSFNKIKLFDLHPHTLANGESRLYIPVKNYSINFPIYWRSIFIRCAIVYRPDLITFTFLADIEKSISSHRKYPERFPDLDYFKAIEVAIRNANSDVMAVEDIGLGASLSALNFSDNERSEALKPSAATLLNNFWSEFKGDLHKLMEVSPLYNGKVFPGPVFADFRGLAIRVDKKANNIFDPEFEKQTQDEKIDLKFSKREFSIDQAHWLLTAFWPFFKASNPGSVTDRNRRDSVAFFTYGRRVIYLSSLGAREDTDEITNKQEISSVLSEHTPIFYFLFLKGRPNTKQLGRLTELIHSLGTFRLAALKDINEIRAVSAYLRHYGSRLDEITAKLAELESRLISTDFEETHIVERERLQESIIILTKDINAKSNLVIGGLHYRTSRSKLFVAQFYKRLKDLDTNKIELWQSYEEFSKRSLSEIFDFIETVDERMSALRNRVRQVSASMQTGSLLDLTSGIFRLQKQTRDLNNNIEKLTGETYKVQARSDALQSILFAIAVALVSSEGLQDFGTASTWTDVKNFFSFNGETPFLNREVPFLPRVYGLLIGIFIGLGVYYWRTQMRKS